MADSLRADPDAYRRLAANLVEYGTFGQGDAPTAYRPPLYPLLLTGCVALGDWSCAAVGALHVAIGAATVALVFVLAQWWGLGRRTAIVAALLTACDPILLAQSAQVMTETTAVFLAVAGLVALTWAARRPSAARMLLAGIVLGLGSLCRPSLLPWAILSGAVLAWQWRFGKYRHSERSKESRCLAGGVILRCAQNDNGTMQNIIPLAAFFLGLLLALAPWAVRNQIQFGRLIVTTTHGGYTLLLANNPSFYQWLRSGRWGSVWSAEGLTDGWNARRPRDELQADRAAYAEAEETIREQPGTFFYSCLVRLGRFWSPLPHQISQDESSLRRMARWAVAAWYVFQYFLVFVGLWKCLAAASTRCVAGGIGDWGLGIGKPLAASQQTACGFAAHSTFATTWLFGLLLIACLMAGHAFYWTDMRMRAPIMPLVALAAAAGLALKKEN